ncbi:MAG: hypothetical protein V3V56_08690 [bacterium]
MADAVAGGDIHRKMRSLDLNIAGDDPAPPPARIDHRGVVSDPGDHARSPGRG